MKRGVAATEVTWPKVGDPRVVLGTPNCVRLNKLKASARSCILNASPLTGNHFISDMLYCLIPSVRRLPMFRGAFPYVNGAGKPKALVSNHAWTFWPRLPSVMVGVLSRLGYKPAECVLELLGVTLKNSGLPLARVRFPPSSQPPMIWLTTAGALEARRLPVPM